MPAASVSIHSMRRRIRTDAGSRTSDSAWTWVMRVSDMESRTDSLWRVNDQLRRRSVGAPAARSVLLTILGEYVLPAPDGAWQETLVGALNTMDYKTHAARQAVA